MLYNTFLDVSQFFNDRKKGARRFETSRSLYSLFKFRKLNLLVNKVSVDELTRDKVSFPVNLYLVPFTTCSSSPCQLVPCSLVNC